MKFSALLLLLCGCSSGALVITPCPEVIKYDLNTQKRAAAELRSLPPGNVLGVMITDYGQMRAACRVR